MNYFERLFLTEKRKQGRLPKKTCMNFVRNILCHLRFQVKNENSGESDSSVGHGSIFLCRSERHVCKDLLLGSSSKKRVKAVVKLASTMGAEADLL